MGLIYLPLLYWLTKLKTGFRWTRSVVFNGGLLIVLGVLITGVAMINLVAGAIVGILAAGCFGLYSLMCLSHMANIGGMLGRLVGLSRNAMMKIKVLRE